MDYQIKEQFSIPGWWRQWGFTKRPENTYTGRRGTPNRHLRVEWTANSNRGTSFNFRFTDLGFSEPTLLRFEYSIKFGSTFTGKGKLPGFGGTYGRAGWGGRRSNGKNGWSARVGFHAADPQIVRLYYYVYHVNQPEDHGQGLGYWTRNGMAIEFERDRWYVIAGTCKLNDPAESNGMLTASVDGQQTFNNSNLRFRTTKALKIETFWFDCWHGGGEADPAPVDMDVFFDRVKLNWSMTSP